ncbi:MAG: hypothetical protein LQ337_002627 [Flavoplaca oasis]|nr:MAG: hypothetical protein LQ337_002627 [Flavoplaca oasis]
MVSDIYQPLRTDEVRFLRILPGGKIAAELEIYPLREAKPYIALSYTWGNAPCNSRLAKAMYDIVLNDRCFKVQENLYDALTYLAHRVRRKECLFWVDAICINQSDVEERNAQIQHMEYIYKHAFKVYGWLGTPHDEEEVRLAVSLMAKFHTFIRDGLAKYNNDMNKVSTTISPDNKGIFPENADSDCYRGWLGIQELFQRSYWRRTWVYQEATNTEGIPFFCGGHHFNMALVCVTVCIASQLSKYAHFPVRFRFLTPGATSHMAAFRDNGVIRWGDSLLELLEYLRTTECSEPRDKVYAILGMAVDLSSPDIIVPNYSKSVADVYTDVVRYSLSRAEHGLQILGHVTHPFNDWTGDDNTPSLPSWVPNYRIHGGPNPFRTQVANSAWAYNACGAHKAHSATIKVAHLIVKGLPVDEIISVSDVWEHDPHSAAEVQAWSPENPDDIYQPTGQNRDEAFRTTVCADINWSTKSRGHFVDWSVTNADNHTLTPDESLRKDQVNDALKSASGCRRLCWTKTGRMGLVPAVAQVGDLLFVLWGGQMMHVLRRKDAGRFFYVGESYVHGVMDGELVTDETGDGASIVLE